MNWFGQKDAPAKSAESADAKAAEKEAVAAEIEALRLVAEVEAMEGLGALYDKAKALHAQDLAGYSFECRRWGDFLTVFLSRLGQGWEDEPVVRSYSTSINIRDSRTITLTKGHAPDLEGALGYSAHLIGDGHSSICGWNWQELEDRKAPDGYRWEVKSWPPRIALHGTMFDLDARSGRDRHFESISRRLPRTRNYLRPAADDRIHFSGVGATIFAPAGKGQEVHDAIMREIARGSE